MQEKRKMKKNGRVLTVPIWSKKGRKQKLIEALEECNLSPTVRGEALTLEQFAKLSNILNARGTK